VGLVRLPAVYIIRLNRVNFDRYGRESRVSVSIDYPDTLDLADGQMWWADTPLDYHGRSCGVRYKLYAVVFHRGGTVRSGHYFASVHSSTGTTPSPAQEAKRKSGGRRGAAGGGGGGATQGQPAVSTHATSRCL
jgi:ubiquitin C-terminal hydrolase